MEDSTKVEKNPSSNVILRRPNEFGRRRIPEILRFAQNDTPPCHCEAGEASRNNLGGGQEIAALRSQ
jgi:hypothetical protein